MKFETGDHIEIDGTCLQGEIDIGYAKLVRVFGEPDEGDAYKVDAQWCIQFDDGTVATVYNYKNGKNYNGHAGMRTDLITNWHIGGQGPEAVHLVKRALGL